MSKQTIAHTKASFHPQPIELVCEIIGIYESEGESHFKLKFDPGVLELVIDSKSEYRLKEKLRVDGNFTVSNILINTPDISK